MYTAGCVKPMTSSVSENCISDDTASWVPEVCNLAPQSSKSGYKSQVVGSEEEHAKRISPDYQPNMG